MIPPKPGSPTLLRRPPAKPVADLMKQATKLPPPATPAPKPPTTGPTAPGAFWLRRWRKANDLTQAEAADKAMVTPRTWRRYEAGDTTIHMAHWLAFRRGLKAPGGYDDANH